MHKAWYAGIFDGEGNVSLYHNRQLISLRSTVTNTHKKTIDCFHKFGGSHWTHSPKQGKKLYRWSIGGEPGLAFLRYIKPYVLTKKKQIQVVLDLYKEIPKISIYRRWRGNESKALKAVSKLTYLR